MPLTQNQILRYSRHLIMPEVGVEGQENLLSARVLLVGAGGLGSPLGLYLSAAGVGHLGLVDFDVVDFSNLHRQIIHPTENVGRPKVDSAKETIAHINPDVEVKTYPVQLSSQNIMEIIKDYDIVIDGTDNFPTRYLVNDACVFTKKPNIYGSIFRFEGQATVFWPGKGPCYRCLYPAPPPGEVPSCAEGGVLGILPGLIGVIQATEAIKIILGKPGTLVGRLLMLDALTMSFTEVKLRRDPSCPVCGENPTIKELINYEEFCGVGRGEESVAKADGIPEITVKELKELLEKKTPLQIIDVREPSEWQICNLSKYGSKLIPLGEVAKRANELDTAQEYVVHCRLGGRSARAVATLQGLGFKKLKNLKGGILQWATEIEPTMPKY